MKTWLRLLIPVILGLIAVWLNTTIMNAKLKPQVFIVMSRNVVVDDVFSAANIQPRSFTGNVAELLQSAILWEDRAVIVGRAVPRPLQSGDIVLWRDATPPARELTPDVGESSLPISLQDIDVVSSLFLVGEEIGFYVDGNLVSPPKSPGASVNPTGSDQMRDLLLQSQTVSAPKKPEYVGPFRVLSVGKRLTRTSQDGNSSTDGQIITVAVTVDKTGATDEKTGLLILAQTQRGGIKSLILHRSKQSRDAIRGRQGKSTP